MRLALRLLVAPFRWLLRTAIRFHSLLFVLAAFTTMAVLAAISGYWLFYRAAYVLGGLVPLCFIWARIHLRGLDVSVERTNDRLQVGEQTETRIHMQSRSMFTKLWLEVEDLTDMPGEAARTVVTLPANGSRNWKISARCSRRGVFTAGPVRVTTGDPFGLFRFSRMYGERQPLMVLPQPEELPYFWAPAAQLAGEGAVHERTHYVTPNAASLREYYPGDSYNRIHWRSTARLGRLMVKTFEMDPTSNVWVVLDLERDVQAGKDDESTEEYGVRIAASLAHRFLLQNGMVGLMAFGQEVTVVDPARGPQQLNRVLEELAMVQANGDRSLARVLQEEGRRFGRNTTVIVVTSSRDEEWVAALQTLIQQGARTAAVVLDAISFRGDGVAPVPLEALTASGVLAYVVTNGSDISLMLGPAGVTGGLLNERQAAGVR